jgi:hypothetical protein
MRVSQPSPGKQYPDGPTTRRRQESYRQAKWIEKNGAKSRPEQCCDEKDEGQLFLLHHDSSFAPDLLLAAELVLVG